MTPVSDLYALAPVLFSASDLNNLASSLWFEDGADKSPVIPRPSPCTPSSDGRHPPLSLGRL